VSSKLLVCQSLKNLCQEFVVAVTIIFRSRILYNVTVVRLLLLSFVHILWVLYCIFARVFFILNVISWFSRNVCVIWSCAIILVLVCCQAHEHINWTEGNYCYYIQYYIADLFNPKNHEPCVLQCVERGFSWYTPAPSVTVEITVLQGLDIKEAVYKYYSDWTLWGRYINIRVFSGTRTGWCGGPQHRRKALPVQ
jgi:hypothetical protein